MRIRWRGVARIAAIVVVAVIGVRLLPDLIRAPEPPPLGRDVGLPKAKPAAVRRRAVARPRPKAVHHSRKPRPKPVAVTDSPASTARIGTRTHRPKHHRHAKAKPSPPPEPTPPPAPEYVPQPADEGASEPLTEPPPDPPSTPGDGSQEFAPR